MSRRRVSPTTDLSAPDYNEEARKLFARLGLSETGEAPAGGSELAARFGGYSPLDAVWCNAETGARVFIGNAVASQSRAILEEHSITAIVNCTTDLPNAFEHDEDAGIRYFNFDIYDCFRFVVDRAADSMIVAFWTPVLEWIDAQVGEGRNVLIHCLAGAHRAGTTGCAYVCHAGRLPGPEATRVCKQLRPVVAPDRFLQKMVDRLAQARGYA